MNLLDVSNSHCCLQSQLHEHLATCPPIVSLETSLLTAITAMDQEQVACVLVADKQRILGMVTQQDVVHLMTTRLDAATVPVYEVMTFPIVPLVDTELHSTRVVEVLQQNPLPYLPVLDSQQQVIGTVTPGQIWQLLGQFETHGEATCRCSQRPPEAEINTMPPQFPATSAAITEPSDSLQQAYQELSFLINNSPLAVIEWDSQFRVRGWSPQAEQLFGWKASEVMGKHPDDWQFVYESDRDHVRSVMVDLLSRQRLQWVCSNRNYTRMGEIVHCEWYNSVLLDKTGKLLAFLSLVLDVTQGKKTEELLKRQLAAIETSIDGIAILDQQGRYIYLNYAHLNLFGYMDASQLLGKPWHVIYSPDEICRLETEALPTLMQQGYWRGEAVGTRCDGSTIPQEVALTRLEDGGLTCICRNISGRKRVEQQLLQSYADLEQRIEERTQELCDVNAYLQSEIVRREELARDLAASEEALRQSEARLQAILDNTQAMVYLKDVQGQYLLVNQTFQRLLGKSAIEIVGQTNHDLFEASIGAAISAADQQVISAKSSLEFEEIVPCQDEMRTYLSVKFPLLDKAGEVYAVGCISTDITLRKQTEAGVLQALSREKELNELKSRFITNTSHEFRTPLTTILGSTELLETSGTQLSPEKRSKHFQRIRTAIQRMASLLDDVLTIGKAEAGKLIFRPDIIDPKAFCQKIIDSLPLLTHHICLTCHGQPVPVVMDETLVWQILENLLSNALKYSYPGGTVYLDLFYHSTTIVFAIQDHGIGIPAKDLIHLFEPFHRAVNVGTIAGNGLGLTIVKRAVELHSGTISIESEVGVGTLCVVELPLVAALPIPTELVGKGCGCKASTHT